LKDKPVPKSHLPQLCELNRTRPPRRRAGAPAVWRIQPLPREGAPRTD
jgi:hypothetical protein